MNAARCHHYSCENKARGDSAYCIEHHAEWARARDGGHTPKKESWEENFDEVFLEVMYKDSGYSEERATLKDFISKLIASERAEAEQRAARIVRGEKCHGKYAHDGDIYSPNEINELLEKIATEIEAARTHKGTKEDNI